MTACRGQLVYRMSDLGSPVGLGVRGRSSPVGGLGYGWGCGAASCPQCEQSTRVGGLVEGLAF